ncbi:MAG TPA: porin family protein [bacterium]|nr:porin family protein [bacterium]
MRMTKWMQGILFLGGLFLAASGPIQAQDIPSLRFGLEVGGSLSDLRYDPSKVNVNFNDLHPGVIGGAFLQVNLSSSFALQPELLYVQEGTHDGTFTAEFDYLEVPLLLKYYFPGIAVKPNLFVGGSVGFNLLAQNNPDDGGAPSKWASNYVSGTEESLIVGAGIDFDKFSVSGRYQMGLSPVTTADYDPNSFQNESFSLMVGYSFI